MSPDTVKVAILGAAGEAAGRILSGLLESKTPAYEVTALARAASASKPAYTSLIAQGVKVVVIDLDGPEAELAKALEGQDVVIASVPPNAMESQLPLIRAAKLANVKRFIPSAFAMVNAPNSVSSVQRMKEKIYTELAASGVPYTIIDVGWWYNAFIPKVASGKTDHAIALPPTLQNLVPADGKMKTYVVDNEDTGNLVARIIADPRTINKKVMAAAASLSFNEMFAIAEELTGEKPVLKYASADEIKGMIAELRSKAEGDPNNYFLLVGQWSMEYYYASFVDGDNSPEGVERLGYILAKDLYPDMKLTSFREFFQDSLAGKKRVPYSDRF